MARHGGFRLSNSWLHPIALPIMSTRIVPAIHIGWWNKGQNEFSTGFLLVCGPDKAVGLHT